MPRLRMANPPEFSWGWQTASQVSLSFSRGLRNVRMTFSCLEAPEDLTGGEESHFWPGLKPAFLLPAGKEKWNRGAVSQASHWWALGVGDPGSNLRSQPQTRTGLGGQQAKTRGRDSTGTDTQRVT